MDSTSTMLWNFEEGIGESDSLGTSSAGSETDPLSMLLTSINKAMASQRQSNAASLSNISMLNGGEKSGTIQNNISNGYNNNGTILNTVNSGGFGAIGSKAFAYNAIGQAAARLAAVAGTPHSRLSTASLFCGDQVGVKCPICMEPFHQPKVLACFHSFCKACLERQLIDRELVETSDEKFQEQRKKQRQLQQSNNNEEEDLPRPILICPLCGVETQLSFQLGIDGLLSDYGLMNAVNKVTATARQQKISGDDKLIFGSPSSTSSSPMLEENHGTESGTHTPATCTSCKSGESATAYCCNCLHYLCSNCTYAHRFMICFEGHRIEDLQGNGCLNNRGFNVGGGLRITGGAVSSGSSSGIGSSNASGGGDNSSGTSPPTTTTAGQHNTTRVQVTQAVAQNDASAFTGRNQLESNHNNNNSSTPLFLNSSMDTVDQLISSNTGNNSEEFGSLNFGNNNLGGSDHCKCLEHRSQPLRFFCLSCNLAICHECTLTEHAAPIHNVETIDDVAEKQIGMMESLINEARQKQAELHEIFRLIDTDQNRLNTSFQQAQNNVEESISCLVQIVQDAKKALFKELENAYGYKQLQLTIIDKEVQKMAKKMSQTIEFTQRLLKYSSPTEVMVFKPLLDSRIQGFLNFNADTSNFLHNAYEIETQALNVSQARQTIFSLLNSIQSTVVASAASAAVAATATVVSSDKKPWTDATTASMLAAAAVQQQIIAQRDQNQMCIMSSSPNSMLNYHQRNSSFNASNNGNNTGTNANNVGNIVAPIGRPLSRQTQKTIQNSSPIIGNNVGVLNSSLTNAIPQGKNHFDDFSAALSDSSLTGNCRQNFGSTHSLLGASNNNLSNGVSTSLGIQILNETGNSHLNNNHSMTNLIGASAPTTNFLGQNLDTSNLGMNNNSQTMTSSSAGAASNMASIFNQYEKWSSGLDPSTLGALSLSDPETITDLSILANAHLGGDKLNAALGNGNAAAFQLYPPRSQIKRQKMTYHCKFGEFGVMEGQFTEPSGVTVNAQNDIIVADTNNHRIQVFDKEGRFKFQFGECGKRDGQLLYPNRVSVNRVTGDFIVTERSPTHQIQIYNQYGNFVRKFGANILQHPRGVCVDNQGRIIVVECKVMRVIIFDAYGNVIYKFNCSRYLEFPNGVCTNDKNEILISDNRAHCIKVFNYEGHYVRQIGGEGITNYPIGVGINSANEVIVADNHNNFNLTVFSQDGTMLNALESKVKHAQCFDVALVEDGSVVLASKDYRLYLYRYQNQLNQQQQLCL